MKVFVTNLVLANLSNEFRLQAGDLPDVLTRLYSFRNTVSNAEGFGAIYLSLAEAVRALCVCTRTAGNSGLYQCVCLVWKSPRPLNPGVHC